MHGHSFETGLDALRILERSAMSDHDHVGPRVDGGVPKWGRLGYPLEPAEPATARA